MDQLIEAGAPEICLKDMAGIGRPGMLGGAWSGLSGETSGYIDSISWS